MCYSHQRASVIVTCVRVIWSPACRCASHLHAGVMPANLYTLVKHAPRSAVVVSYGARAHDMDAAHPVGPTSGTWAKIRPPGAAKGPQKGLFGPKWALLGAPGVP